MLALYRVGAETQLHTDASKEDYGAILLQKNSEDGLFHPIYYASGKTTPAESRYSSYELEVLAIVKSLRKFRVYLLSIPFKIYTDCRAFTLTMKKKDLCVRVARWALQLEEFECEIVHRPGTSMKHVDALSRNPLPECFYIRDDREGLFAKLGKAQQEDVEIRKMFEKIGQEKREDFEVRRGVLYKEEGGNLKIEVPKQLQTQIIRKIHEEGHFAVLKTEMAVKRDFHIVNLRPKIERVIGNCIQCILADKKSGKGEGWLRSLDKGSTPLHTYHIDHLGPLSSTAKSYKHILVVKVPRR